MCKFSMVTRSQQQAAWPGLRNSGTNTRKQAACSGSCAGQWSLAYPSPPAEAHSCSTCAPASSLQGHQEQGWWYPLCFRTSEYCADTLCYQINRLPSEASASTHVFFFLNASYPSAMRESAPCVPRLADHFFQLQTEELTLSTQL